MLGATWATARCPACATPLATVVPAMPGARWLPCPHCGSPVPVLPPTNPPPIFSWEVYPQVYPPLPTLRVPSRSFGRLAAVALLICAVLLAGLAGALTYGGVEALGPTTFRLSGTVVEAPGSVAVAGATLVLHTEGGSAQQTVSGFDGSFAFSGIPAGGASLNVSAPGYQSVAYELFFSPAYTATGAGSGGLVVDLVRGTGANATVVFSSEFGSLEGFVSSLFSAGALLALGALLAAVGAVSAYRDHRRTVAVAAGFGAALAPATLPILGVSAAFPLTGAPAAVLVCLGLVAAVLELMPLVWAGHAAELA